MSRFGKPRFRELEEESGQQPDALEFAEGTWWDPSHILRDLEPIDAALARLCADDVS